MTETPIRPSLRDLYEEHTSPKREPDEERFRLVVRPMETLARINHFVFAGGQEFGPGSRILTAGAGAGDETLYLAEQLRARGGTVVYLDSSSAAVAVCARRAAVRQLDNIEFRQGRIEDLDPDVDGLFDYVHCVDVLHQLSDPASGARRLAGVLAKDGGMGLVLKSPQAFRGAGALRDLIDHTTPPTASLQQIYQDGLALAAALAPDHGFFRRQPREAVLRDVTSDPCVLLEQVLGPRAGGFDVGAIHDLVADCGLTLVEFAPADIAAPLFTLFYNPDFYVTDPRLSRQLADLPLRRRHEIAELLHGAMGAHGVYCARDDGREALPTDEGMVPSLAMAPSAFHISNNRLLISDYEGRPYEFEATPSIQLMFHLIDGEKTIGEIVAEGNRLFAQVGLPAVDLFATFLHLYSNLRNFGWVTLRRKSVSAFPRFDHLYYPAAGWVQPAGAMA